MIRNRRLSDYYGNRGKWKWDCDELINKIKTKQDLKEKGIEYELNKQ